MTGHQKLDWVVTRVLAGGREPEEGSQDKDIRLWLHFSADMPGIILLCYVDSPA